MRMSVRILPTARTGCLPISCSCSSARARARVLVLVLECTSCSRTSVISCSFWCSSALVLARARANYAGRSRPHTFHFRLFALCSVCCCEIVRQGQFYPPTPSLMLDFAQLQKCFAGTQQHLQHHQHPRLYQQQCGSAAAAHQ